MQYGPRNEANCQRTAFILQLIILLNPYQGGNQGITF
jgi:hypothetical protein